MLEIAYTSEQFDENPPEHATDGAAAVDMRALQAGEVKPGKTAMIATGLSMAIPEGYFGLVCSRSGLAAKYSVFVANTAGVVDSDYRGGIMILLHNAGGMPFTYGTGDRIAQMVFLKYERANFTRVPVLPATVRGAGGFGSTGV